MSIVVYFLKEDLTPGVEHFTDDQLVNGLEKCAELRALGFTHVTMVSQLANQVGLPGVTCVKDGKLPDGTDYTWSKAHRAGARRHK